MMINSVFALRRGFATADAIPLRPIKFHEKMSAAEAYAAILSITHLCAQDNAHHRKKSRVENCAAAKFPRRVMYKWERMWYNKT